MPSENSHSCPCTCLFYFPPFPTPSSYLISFFGIPLGFTYANIIQCKYGKPPPLLNTAGKSYENRLPGPTFKSVLSSALSGALPLPRKIPSFPFSYMDDFHSDIFENKTWGTWSEKWICVKYGSRSWVCTRKRGTNISIFFPTLLNPEGQAPSLG